MNILTANTITTTKFSSKLEEINVKYKKEKEDLKKIIAETARSQAEQILADDNDDSMGNPEELCKKLAELRLQYNSIIVKQKEEFDSTMKEYTDQIMTNMGKSPNPSVTKTSIPTNIQGLAIEIINSDKNIKQRLTKKLTPPVTENELRKLCKNFHVARRMEMKNENLIINMMYTLIRDDVLA